MQMGFNNDVEYKGLTLHIQTEDHGLSAMKITSQVFRGGAIVDSKTMSYVKEVDGMEDEARDEKIRAIMKALHRKFYQRIHEGIYDAQLPLEEAPAAPDEAPAPEPEEPPVEAPSEEPGLDVPTEMLAAEGFAVAGEMETLGKAYEEQSRGAPMTDFEPETLRGEDIEEMAAQMSGPTGPGFVQLGGLGSGAHEIPEAANAPAEPSTPVYSGEKCFLGLDVPGDFGAVLLRALSA